MSMARAAGSWALLGGLSIAAALQPVACSGDGDTPETLADCPIVEEMLADVGPEVVIPALEHFQSELSILETALLAYQQALEVGEDPAEAIALAQESWVESMLVWQELEMMQIGPQASSLMAVGGEDLRDEIYSWPSSVNPCRVDQVTADQSYLADDFFTANLVNAYGLDALGHVLFADFDCACPGQVDPMANGAWDALGEDGIRLQRMAFAEVLLSHLSSQASELIDAWDPDGGDFSGKLARTSEGTPYSSNEEALSAVFDALFYLEIHTKDLKLGVPLGLIDCDEERCPEDVEHLLSQASLTMVEANLRGFRSLFNGGDGVGLDDVLESVGHGDLAEEISANLDEALLALWAIEGPLSTAIEEDPTQVETLYAKVLQITDVLEGDLATVLSLQVPEEAAGDND
jgi:predicted lipoprotein